MRAVRIDPGLPTRRRLSVVDNPGVVLLVAMPAPPAVTDKGVSAVHPAFSVIQDAVPRLTDENQKDCRSGPNNEAKDERLKDCLIL